MFVSTYLYSFLRARGSFFFLCRALSTLSAVFAWLACLTTAQLICVTNCQNLKNNCENRVTEQVCLETQILDLHT